jgi:uncharacterized NAD-dependent epimerase/dehydratase family protein
LATLIEMHERIISFVKPARVIGIVLDTSALNPEAAAEAIARAEEETGLPADDPVRNSGAKLWKIAAGALTKR